MVRRHRVLTGERARSGQWRSGVAARAARAQRRVYHQAMLTRHGPPSQTIAPPSPTLSRHVRARSVRQAALVAILLVPLSAVGWALVHSQPAPVVVEPQTAGEVQPPLAAARQGTVVATDARHPVLAHSQQRIAVEKTKAPALELADVTPMPVMADHAPEAAKTVLEPHWPTVAVAARAMPDIWHRQAENRCVVADPVVLPHAAVVALSATLAPPRAAVAVPGASAPDETPSAFGERLARAAERQLNDVVIYSDRYASISYPMGDVSPLYGVCTDVIIRAYRALGIDLQQRIHEAKGGRGDRNIDHRRVAIMRRFFAAFGQTLPITDIADDYRAGDIVTYDRPQNRGSRAHVAIVSNERAPSGRPMIVHNRGWGPQLEDALFVDEITGHYRYDGRQNAAKAMASQTWPSFLKLRKRSVGRAKSRASERAPTVPARASVTLKPKAMRRAHQFKARTADD